MSEGKGQRKWPIPAGFVWDHNRDCYTNEHGDTWNPDTNQVTAHSSRFQEAQAPAPAQQESVESQILRLQATASRVTPADVQGAIKSAYFFRASDGVLRTADASPPQADFEALQLLTFCVLVLKNGFTVVGKSACASPENYRRDVGERVAREDAERQIWPLLGFELKQMLHVQHVAGIEG